MTRIHQHVVQNGCMAACMAACAVRLHHQKGHHPMYDWQRFSWLTACVMRRCTCAGTLSTSPHPAVGVDGGAAGSSRHAWVSRCAHDASTSNDQAVRAVGDVRKTEKGEWGMDRCMIGRTSCTHACTHPRAHLCLLRPAPPAYHSCASSPPPHAC